MIEKLNKQFYRKFFQRYELIVPNAYFKGQTNEMDIAGVRKSGFLDEIEIKMSIADFKNDFNKKARVFQKVKGIRRARNLNKHNLLKAGKLPCNYFYFMLSEELAEQCKIPKYAGLIIYRILDKNRIHLVEKKEPTRLHTNKLTLEDRYNMCKKIYYKYWR